MISLIAFCDLGHNSPDLGKLSKGSLWHQPIRETSQIGHLDFVSRPRTLGSS